MLNFMVNLLNEKNSLKNSNIPEARQTLKILCVTISSHIISFRFLSIFENLRATQKSQNRLIWSRKISCNWGKKNFFDYLKRKKFLEPIAKNPYTVVITGEPMSALCLRHYFGYHENLYISCSFFYFSFVINNAKPTCFDCVNSNIYSCILSLLKLHGTFYFMN